MNTKTFLRRRIALWLIALMALALTATNTFAASTKSRHQEKPTVVLVHGAFADASSFARVRYRAAATREVDRRNSRATYPGRNGDPAADDSGAGASPACRPP